jgi:hypothetical protein
VGVAYDLSVVIEQLPVLLAGLREHAEVELDFYSQGIERTLRFTQVASQIEIECISRTSWLPNPAVEITSPEALASMLVRLARDFATSLESVSPGIASVAPFSDWLVGRV